MAPPIVLAVAAFLVSDAQPRRYEAVAALVYQPTRGEQLLDEARNNALVERDIKTEEQLLTGPAYRREFEARFGDDVTIDADALDGTDLIEVIVEAPTPAAAATIANAVVAEYVEQRRAAALDELDTARTTMTATVDDLESEIEETNQAIAALQPSTVPTVDDVPATPTEQSRARIVELERRRESLDGELAIARTALRRIETEAALTNGDVRAAGEAVEPSSPVSPQPTRSAILGAMLGALIGLGSAWLRETGDRRLYSTDDVLEVDGAVELIGRVPKPSELPSTGPVSLLVTAVANRFKLLANALAPSGSPMAIQIAGVAGGEGATYVALNTAVTLAVGGWRTVLVDADLGDGDLHRILGVEPSPGVTDVLAGDPLSAATQASRLVPGLHVVSRGSEVADATVLSSALSKLINALRARFDVVIIDGPPVLAHGDAAVLGTQADRTILVVEAGRSTGPDVGTAIDVIAMGGGRVSGLVITDTTRAVLDGAQPDGSVLNQNGSLLRLGEIATAATVTGGTVLLHPAGGPAASSSSPANGNGDGPAASGATESSTAVPEPPPIGDGERSVADRRASGP